MRNKDNQQSRVNQIPSSIIKSFKKHCTLSNICFLMSIVLIVIGALVLSNTIRKGSESANDAYESAKAKAEGEAYDKFYSSAFESAERKNHVSNRVTIEVESAREKADLEVLSVSDVEYVIGSADNTEAWVEYYGDGVYTVDMRESEFIIDSERQYVLVRVPRPTISNCRITSSNTLLLQNEGFLNKNDAAGVELAKEMRSEGYTKLCNYMKSNAEFYKSAKKSAEITITELVKGLNPELEDLEVEVQFVE